MTPYYQRNGITIYCGDCLKVMPHLEPFFDAVVTDPPYGTKDGRGKVHKQGSELVEFNVGDWDEILPLSWINSALDLLRLGSWIVAFTDNLSVKAVWDEMEKSGARGKQTFYWIKSNPPPQPRKNFCSGVETAVAATRGAVKRWYGGGWYKNYIEHPLVTGPERTSHKTQKPIGVMSCLIRPVTKPTDIILDPFMGSGTTLVAAQNEGRRAVGIELSEEYCQIAVERLRQPSFFSLPTDPPPEPDPEQPSLWERELLNA